MIWINISNMFIVKFLIDTKIKQTTPPLKLSPYNVQYQTVKCPISNFKFQNYLQLSRHLHQSFINMIYGMVTGSVYYPEPEECFIFSEWCTFLAWLLLDNMNIRDKMLIWIKKKKEKIHIMKNCLLFIV